MRTIYHVNYINSQLLKQFFNNLFPHAIIRLWAIKLNHPTTKMQSSLHLLLAMNKEQKMPKGKSLKEIKLTATTYIAKKECYIYSDDQNSFEIIFQQFMSDFFRDLMDSTAYSIKKNRINAISYCLVNFLSPASRFSRTAYYEVHPEPLT